MIIQDLVDPKASFDANNEPKNLTSDEAKSELKKAILAARVSQYIEREASLASNINIFCGIIWVQCTLGIQLLLNVNKDYLTKSNFCIPYGS